MTKFLAFIALMIVGIPTTLLSGLVFSDLWRWFVVPIFHVPALTYLQAVGVMYVTSYCVRRLKTSTERDEDQSILAYMGSVMIGGVLTNLLFWSFGAAWHQFI